MCLWPLGWLLAILALWVALRKAREQLGERQVPNLGVLAAFIFAAQAINFPVAGGTSGHLLGGALAALVLGPWPAILVMTSVVSLQALLFQDGGLLAMGWNIVNMGVLTVLSAWLVWRIVRRIMPRGRPANLGAGAIGAWLSVEVGAVATAAVLAASGTAAFDLTFPAMVGVHTLIGAGEAIITLGALNLIYRVRPDLLANSRVTGGNGEAVLAAAGLLLSVLLATLSLAGSDAPDGLERVATDQGFIDQALDPLVRIMPGYTVPQGYGLARLLRRDKANATAPDNDETAAPGTSDDPTEVRLS